MKFVHGSCDDFGLEKKKEEERENYMPVRLDGREKERKKGG